MLNEATRALVVLSAAAALRDPARLAQAVDDAATKVDAAAAEEALLQSYLFIGFPGALQAIGVWRERTGLAAPAAGGEERALTREDRYARGAAVCRAVYGSAFDALQRNVQALHAELGEWMLEEGYGKVLGRPGLPLVVRELCIVGLLAAQSAPRQLFSHLRGAHNAGATAEEIDAALDAIAGLLPIERSAAAWSVWQEVRARTGNTG
jgi:4-carboxymuconolactone decarboxylase